MRETSAHVEYEHENKAGEMKENKVSTCLERFFTQLRQRCCRDDDVLRGCCSLPAVFLRNPGPTIWVPKPGEEAGGPERRQPRCY